MDRTCGGTESDIASLFDHFKEYIYDFEMRSNGMDHTLLLRYTPWAYDLIDCDLDFDEMYYGTMMGELDRWLDIYAKEHVTSTGVTVMVEKSLMLFRSESVLDSETTYRYVDGNVRGNVEVVRRSLVKVSV